MRNLESRNGFQTKGTKGTKEGTCLAGGNGANGEGKGVLPAEHGEHTEGDGCGARRKDGKVRREAVLADSHREGRLDVGPWWRRRRKPRPGELPYGVREVFSDPITRAFARERAAGVYANWQVRERAVGLEFKCVCCERTRPGRERREPGSQVCVRCVQEAGFV